MGGGVGGHFYIRAVIRGERGREAFHSFRVFGIIKKVNEYMRQWSFIDTLIDVASVLKENGQKRTENKDANSCPGHYGALQEVSMHLRRAFHFVLIQKYMCVYINSLQAKNLYYISALFSDKVK